VLIDSIAKSSMSLNSLVVIVEIELMDLLWSLVGNMPADMNLMAVVEQLALTGLGLSYMMIENMPADLNTMVVIEQIALTELGLPYTMVEDMPADLKGIVVGMTKNLWTEMMGTTQRFVCTVMERILVDLGFDFAAKCLSGTNLVLTEDFRTGLTELDNLRSLVENSIERGSNWGSLAVRNLIEGRRHFLATPRVGSSTDYAFVARDP